MEDDKEVNDLIRRQLKKQGYKTIAAYDGEMTLKLFSQYSIDLMILDIMIPIIDGIEVMAKIRRKKQFIDSDSFG